jgi:hypothetical protein
MQKLFLEILFVFLGTVVMLRKEAAPTRILNNKNFNQQHLSYNGIYPPNIPLPSQPEIYPPIALAINTLSKGYPRL